jgi:6-phosphogluconolactonase
MDLVPIIVRELDQTIQKKGKAVMVLCGGSTPLTFYQELSRQSLDWQKVYVTTCDEHFQDNQNIKKHEGIVREYFLKDKAGAANFIPLHQLATSDLLTNQKCFFATSLFNEIDIMFLGLGVGGHTASIFSDANNTENILHEKEDLFMVHSLLAKNPRITIGLQRLLKAQKIFFLLQGSEKLQILIESLASSGEEINPIKFFTRDNVSVYWTLK